MHAIRGDTPEGFRGTQRTLAAMHALARDGAGDLAVRNLAARIVAGCPRRAYADEAACLLAWVQRNVRYVRDPAIPGDGLERVQHPRVTLFEMPAEDCDGLSVALAALWGSIGGTYAFRTVGDGPDPDDFRHVYVMLLLYPSGWTPADPSFEEALGWEPSQAVASVLRDGTQLARVTQVRDWPA